MHTENCISQEIYSPFWSWSQPFSTTYRLMSSFHSNGVLLSLGTGRKRVILSVEGWSELRTQHTSPGLDHWPAKHRARRQLSAGNRTAMIHGCGKTTWPLHRVALSCRRSSRLANAVCGVDFNPTDRWSTEAWRHGGIKIDFVIMNHTTTSWVMHLLQKAQGWQNVLNTPHRRTRCTSPETEDHGRLSAEHRVLYETFNYVQVCCTPMTLRRNMCHKGAFDKYLRVM